MEYPGVRLGQRGGLYDLYQYYLGGGDQATGDEGPVTTVSMPVTTGGGGGGEGIAGIDPFAERTKRDYSPEGMARRAGNTPFTFIDQGIQNFKRTFTPDRYYEYTGAFEDDDEGTIYPEAPRKTSFFDKLKTGGSMIKTPIMALLSAGRPADAIYSYGGDASGVGARAGLTPEEVRNMEYLEAFGGVDEYGRDIYGKNVVSAFGDYEQGVKDDLERLETQLIKNATKYGVTWDKETGKITPIKEGDDDSIKTFKSMNKLMLQKYDDYSGFDAKVEKAAETRKQDLMKMRGPIGQDTTGGITETIIPPKKPEPSVVDVDKTKALIEAAKNRERVASSSRGIQSAGNRAPPSGGGGRDSGSAAARGMGGGSQQAKSSGSTKSGRSDGGWGWKDGGLVTRKPYGDGGIVDLL